MGLEKLNEKLTTSIMEILTHTSFKYYLNQINEESTIKYYENFEISVEK
jgi:hypothetical protein